MFDSIKRKLALSHQKAAKRQMGLSAYYYYAIGLFFAVAYVFIFSFTALKDNIEITKSVVTGAGSVKLQPLMKTETPRKEQTREEKLTAIGLKAWKHYPAVKKVRGSILDMSEVTEKQAMKERNLMVEWERKTGKNFLRDHRTMKPHKLENSPTANRLRDFIKDADILGRISPQPQDVFFLTDLFFKDNISGNWKGRKHRIATKAEMNKCARDLKRKKIEDKKPTDWGTSVNSGRKGMWRKSIFLDGWCDNGIDLLSSYSKGVHTYSEWSLKNRENGLCYVYNSSNSSIKKTVNNGFEHKGYIVGDIIYNYYPFPVLCGSVWREHMTNLYNSKTPSEMRLNSKYYKMYTVYNEDINASLKINKRHSDITEKARLEYVKIMIRKIDDNAQKSKVEDYNNSVKRDQKPEYSKFINRVKLADINQIEALRVTALLGAFMVLFIYLLAGNKYAILRKPRFINRGFILYSVPFLGVYGWTFIINAGSVYSSLLTASLLFIPPFLMMVVPTYNMVIWEYLKEHREYREWGILGKHGGAGRWGGIKSFFQRDITDLVSRTQKNGIQKEKNSTLYLGMTNYKDDYQLIGRHIGVVSEQHLIINSSSGGGKSLYSITNMLSLWNGGLIVNDIKGEHWNTTAAHRAKIGDTWLLDPFGVIKSRESDQWNPLAEINPDSPTAKADLQRLCEAIIIKNSDSKNDHFDEIGQQVIKGFIAHVLTTFPENKRHLGSVYDLFEMGRLQGEEPRRIPAMDAKGKPILDPVGEAVTREENHLEAINRILKDMEKNEAIAGAAREGASKLQRVGDNERGSFYSTVSKSIAWVNDEMVRPIITGRHDFSVSDVKTKEASIYLALPESYLDQQMRLVRVFFQLASDMVDNFKTERNKAHKRQTLFVFEEFNKFGYFKTAEDIACFKRSSGVKAVFVVQNINQIERHYPNKKDFYSNCDKLFYALSGDDEEGLSLISKAIGGYKEQTNNNFVELNRNVAENHEIKELIDGEGNRQIFMPVHGKIIKLNRVKCFKLFKWTKH